MGLAEKKLDYIKQTLGLRSTGGLSDDEMLRTIAMISDFTREELREFERIFEQQLIANEARKVLGLTGV